MTPDKARTETQQAPRAVVAAGRRRGVRHDDPAAARPVGRRRQGRGRGRDGRCARRLVRGRRTVSPRADPVRVAPHRDHSEEQATRSPTTSRCSCEKFLGPDALPRRSASTIPRRNSAWLGEPANTEALGGCVTKLMSFALDMTDDARIQSFVHDAFRAVIDRIDLSQSAGAILDTLTKRRLPPGAARRRDRTGGRRARQEENREVIAVSSSNG